VLFSWGGGGDGGGGRGRPRAPDKRARPPQWLLTRNGLDHARGPVWARGTAGRAGARTGENDARNSGCSRERSEEETVVRSRWVCGLARAQEVRGNASLDRTGLFLLDQHVSSRRDWTRTRVNKRRGRRRRRGTTAANWRSSRQPEPGAGGRAVPSSTLLPPRADARLATQLHTLQPRPRFIATLLLPPVRARARKRKRPSHHSRLRRSPAPAPHKTHSIARAAARASEQRNSLHCSPQ
jgi:hypothetical protein